MLTHPIPPQPRVTMYVAANPRGNLRDRRAGKRTFCKVYNGRNTLARASLRPTGAKNKDGHFPGQTGYENTKMAKDRWCPEDFGWHTGPCSFVNMWRSILSEVYNWRLLVWSFRLLLSSKSFPGKKKWGAVVVSSTRDCLMPRYHPNALRWWNAGGRVVISWKTKVVSMLKKHHGEVSWSLNFWSEGWQIFGLGQVFHHSKRRNSLRLDSQIADIAAGGDPFQWVGTHLPFQCVENPKNFTPPRHHVHFIIPWSMFSSNRLAGPHQPLVTPGKRPGSSQERCFVLPVRHCGFLTEFHQRVPTKS